VQDTRQEYEAVSPFDFEENQQEQPATQQLKTTKNIVENAPKTKSFILRQVGNHGNTRQDIIIIVNTDPPFCPACTYNKATRKPRQYK